MSAQEYGDGINVNNYDLNAKYSESTANDFSL